MHIIMHMPTRNVYVSDEDQNLFQEAAELAGGFSPAVSEALREYVKRRKLMMGGAEQVEVDLRTDGIDHRVSFMGRRLVKVQRDHEQGCRIDTVYATARKQFAVVSKVRRVLPSWAGGKEDLWSHPETWDKEFWTVGDRTLKVFANLDELRAADGELAERVDSALHVAPYEVLDI